MWNDEDSPRVDCFPPSNGPVVGAMAAECKTCTPRLTAGLSFHSLQITEDSLHSQTLASPPQYPFQVSLKKPKESNLPILLCIPSLPKCAVVSKTSPVLLNFSASVIILKSHREGKWLVNLLILSVPPSG